MSEKSDGPCRNVGRSRKRSASDLNSLMGDARLIKCQRSSTEGQGQGVLNGEGKGKKCDGSYDINMDKLLQKRTQRCENTETVKGDIKMESVNDQSWFTNSFMHEKYHSNKIMTKTKNGQSTAQMKSMEASECKPAGHSVSSRGRIDLKLSADPAPRQVLLTQSDKTCSTNTSNRTGVNHYLVEQTESMENDDTSIFFHSTPTKIQQVSRSTAACEDCLNNSDLLLADIDLNLAETGKGETRNCSVTARSSGTKDIKQHPPDKQPITTVTHDVKPRLNKSSASYTQKTKGSFVDGNTSYKENLNGSGSDLFEKIGQDDDFLSQIEDLEKQINNTVFKSFSGNDSNKRLMKGSSLKAVDAKQTSLKENMSEKNKAKFNSSNCQYTRDDSESMTDKNMNESADNTVALPLKKQVIGCVLEQKTPKVVTNEHSNVSTDDLVVPVTPLGSAKGSLRDRIKRKLQENASTKLLQSPGVLQQQMREDVVQKAHTEAEELKKEGTSQDIGPFYGLPSKVQQLLKDQRGIKDLYDWQDECLKLPAVMQSRNLIYSLPTSGGKTLVAEILIMRELLCKKRDAMLILPFVSIVQEKVRGMSQLSVELDFLVEEYAGSKGRFPPLKRRQKKSLYIATIEKSHSIINSLLENKRLNDLGLVVVDELHMIGEGGSRGATLEAALLKLIYSKSNTQIIGMSATLSSISDLQAFLHADVYSNDFRPVELTEYVKIQDNIYQVKPEAKCPDDQLFHDRVVPFTYTPEMNKVDPDHVLGLVMEVVPDRSCLVFCPTKKNCENVAMMLCKLMVKHHHDICSIKKAEKKALLKELYNDGAGKICPTLQYTVHFGVAYHHSGLTTDERKLIEEAYSEGTLCLLTCTSTLAAGVNLPAKRVILRSPYVGSQFISRSQYKQMVGRAGRAGIDTTGESILIMKQSDGEKVSNMLTGPIEVCTSSLKYDGDKGLRTLILSAIGLQLTPTTKDVFSCINQTLLNVQSKDMSDYNITEVTQRSLQQLVDLGLVVQKRSLSQENEEPVHQIEVTPLGRATFKGSVNLDYAGRLYKDLMTAEESLGLASHLHLLYLVTPYDMVDMVKPSWITYFQELSTLNPAEIKVATLIGVTESYITKKASGRHTKQVVDDFVVVRFYLTMMLHGLWKQKSVWEIAERFQQPRGFIQNLLSSAASFASCVFHFCQELDEFWAYQDLMGNFVKKLSYCVTAELIPLMEIPGVKLGRAKQLYSCGYQTLSAMASADPEDIVKAVKIIPRKIAKQIVMSAKMVLNEKAEALLQEVESLVAIPTEPAVDPVSQASSQGSTVSSVPSSVLFANLQEDFQEEFT